MRLLLAGEDGTGSLLRSLQPGLQRVSDVTVVNPYRPTRSRVARAAWRLLDPDEGRLLEATYQLRPDALLLVKGRGISPAAIGQIRRSGCRVAVYYPDNPLWRWQDAPDPLPRLRQADLLILWQERLVGLLASSSRRVEVVPFGYDDRWFPLVPTGGARHGIVFIGHWSRRRERFLRALDDLPLTVRGGGWDRSSLRDAGPGVFETDAGRLLASAQIGVNLLHPQCTGAHNMRTREVSASGALQLTDAGVDGTPLRPGTSCVWFRTPEDLRSAAESWLRRPEEAVELAGRGQVLIANDTYRSRGEQIGRLVAQLVAA
ncbi:MAG: glycosyltransferase [Acidimicrobiales bacterium]|nr:glycosyltransferase [Acidimicrobiales bacterium]